VLPVVSDFERLPLTSSALSCACGSVLRAVFTHQRQFCLPALPRAGFPQWGLLRLLSALQAPYSLLLGVLEQLQHVSTILVPV